MKSKKQSKPRYLISFQHEKNALKQQFAYRDFANRLKHILA